MTREDRAEMLALRMTLSALITSMELARRETRPEQTSFLAILRELAATVPSGPAPDAALVAERMREIAEGAERAITDAAPESGRPFP